MVHDGSWLVRGMIEAKRIAGRFELEAVVGEGAMGVVHRARDVSTGELVALKLQRLDALDDERRFLREGRTLSELRHPAIVGYVDHGVGADGRAYLAMEWIDGVDLARYAARRALGVRDTVAIARRIAGALGAIHARGLVHRDIKPSNVFLAGGDPLRATLLDFGIARDVAGAGVTEVGVVVGTPAYLSPEQARAERLLDARADVFALGSTMYRCLAGRAPFGGGDAQAVLARVAFDLPPGLLDLRPELPPSLVALVTRMMAPRRADRPRDGEAVLRELEAWAAAHPDALAEGALDLAASDEASAEHTRREWPSGSEAPSGAVSADEQRFVAVVALERQPARVSLRHAAVDTLVLSPHEPSPLEHIIAAHGADAVSLADGTLLAIVGGIRGSTNDLARAAARCALALRDASVGSRIALATARAHSRADAARSGAIDLVLGLLVADRERGEQPTGVSIDALTDRLLGDDFARERMPSRIVLSGERVALDDRLLGRASVFVGRDAELAILSGTWQASVAQQSAHAALVSGPPGAGKSRLVRELLARAPADALVYTARADVLRAGAPRALAADLVRAAIGLREGEDASARAAALSAHVSAHLDAPHAARVRDFLGELVGTPQPSAPQPALVAARRDPLVMADQVARAFIDWLAALARRAPVALALEDVQWADRASLALVDRALAELAELPLFVIATARPEVSETHPGLWRARGVTQVALRDLSVRAASSMVRATLGEALSEARVAALVARSAGNPFMLEELIRAASEGVPDELAPESVLAVLGGRLERLPPEARRVLRAASVVGDVFWDDAVLELLGGEPVLALDYWLDVLRDQELLVERARCRFSNAREHAFRHALVRDAAYAMLTDEDRARGHRAAASWLERAGETEPLVIAEHLVRGEEPLRAVEWYVRAAEAALEANDFDATLARVSRGIECGADGESLGALLVMRAEVQHWRGDPRGATESATRAAALLAPESARWFLAASRGAHLTAMTAGDVAPLEALAERLLHSAARERAEERAAQILATVRTVMALDLHGGSRSLAAALLARLGPLSDELARSDPGVAGHVHHVVGTHAQRVDADTATYLERFLAAAECAERAGERRMACARRGEAAYARSLLGDYAQAVLELRATREEARALGLEPVVVISTQNLGLALTLAGEPIEGLAEQSVARAAFARHGNALFETASLVYMTRAHLALGDIEPAVRTASEALERAPQDDWRAQARAVLALALLAAGEPDRALVLASAAAEAVARDGAFEGLGLIALAHVEALVASGARDEARAALSSSIEALHARARRISSEPYRRSFLERVPEHAALIALSGAIGAHA